MSEKELPFGADEESIALGHQPDKVNMSAILTFGVGLVVVCVVVFAVLFLIMNHYGRVVREKASGVPAIFSDKQGLYPEPRLQFSPPRDMAKYAQEVRERQSSYRWVDRKKEIAQIPIDRAIDLSLQKSLFPSRVQASPQPGPDASEGSLDPKSTAEGTSPPAASNEAPR